VVAALLLTGAPGTGKSSTLEALSTLLEIEAVGHGAIEAEQLAWGWPWLSVGDAAEQLGAVLEIQRRAGRRLFLVAAGVEDEQEMALLAGALRADLLLVVCLAAPPDVVAARLEGREPDHWPGKLDLIRRAKKLATTMPRVEGIDLIIDTTAADAREVAAQIRDAMSARGLLAGGRWIPGEEADAPPPPRRAPG
jgi:broad-specificity NMP kinase